MKLRLGRRAAVIVSSVTLLLVAGGAAAYAVASSGPVDSAGVIHGCYSTQSIRGSHVFVLQDAGTTCPRGTTAISWSKQPGSAAGSGVVTARSDTAVNFGQSDGSTVSAHATCPANYQVVGGGYGPNGALAETWVPYQAFPDTSSRTYYVGMMLTGTPFTPGPGDPTSWDLSVFATCLPE